MVTLQLVLLILGLLIPLCWSARLLGGPLGDLAGRLGAAQQRKTQHGFRESRKIPGLDSGMSVAVVDLVCCDQLS